MSLFDEMNIVSSEETVGFNTGTLFDLGTGSYDQGVNRQWILNGGLGSFITGVVGMNGMYKTTFAWSAIIRSMGIYPGTECIIDDTENTLDRDKERALNMAGEFTVDPSRIVWLKGIDYDLDNLYAFVKEICLKKAAHKNDYMVETPFIDKKTLKPLRVWMPTYLFIDSLTELISAAEEEMINGPKAAGLGEKANNTIYMLDGNKKTILIRSLRRLAQQYGLIVVCTGHYDKKIQMDMYSSNPKETQFGKNEYSTRGCGSKFKFLTGLYARTQASLLQDSNKEALYSWGATPNTDVNEVQVYIERCKANRGGSITPFVVSQSIGLLNDVSNYHYLRINDYFGLNGNKQKQQPFLTPEITISRNTIREVADANAQVRRALEIAAQLKFIQNNWITNNIPYNVNIAPQALFDGLMSDKNKNLIERVLNSRGYWTYAKDDKEYLSIFEIVDLINKNK